MNEIQWSLTNGPAAGSASGERLTGRHRRTNVPKVLASGALYGHRSPVAAAAASDDRLASSRKCRFEPQQFPSGPLRNPRLPGISARPAMMTAERVAWQIQSSDLFVTSISPFASRTRMAMASMTRVCDRLS